MQKRIGITLLFLCIIAIIVSGCTSSATQPAPVTTPTPQIVYVTVTVTPTPTTSQDPIIGTWRYYDEGSDARIKFGLDRSFSISFLTESGGLTTISGTWTNQGNNIYDLTAAETGKSITWVYLPDKRIIYWDQFPSLKYSPFTGEIMTEGPASSSQASGSITISGNGDDVQSFTTTGNGIRIFSMTYSGERNFAVWLDDSNGGHIDLLANEIGSYAGKKSQRLGPGKYYLDVTASGPWRVTISSP
jgi:hypothetical protein